MTDYETMLAMLGGFVLVFLLFFLACLVLLVIANWKIFEKAGKPGWASLIPYYSTYVTYDLLNMKDWFIVYIVAVVVGMFTNGYLEDISGLVIFGLFIYECIKLAKAFGKDAAFTVGLVLLPIVFFPILAFGDATYQPENL